MLATVLVRLQTMKWMSVIHREAGLWQVRSESSEPLLQRGMWQARRLRMRVRTEPGPGLWSGCRPGATLAARSPQRPTCLFLDLAEHTVEAQASSDGNSERAFWRGGDRGACEKVKSHSGHEGKGPPSWVCQFCWNFLWKDKNRSISNKFNLYQIQTVIFKYSRHCSLNTANSSNTNMKFQSPVIWKLFACCYAAFQCISKNPQRNYQCPAVLI